MGQVKDQVGAAMQLSFYLAQKGVPSRLQLLPREIGPGDGMHSRSVLSTLPCSS